MVHEFIQKYGAFLLAVVMAIVTVGGAKGVIDSTQRFHAEQITEAKHKLDKLGDTIGTMREEQARQSAQISYLVQLCGDKKTHSNASFGFGPVDFAKNP